MSSHEHGRVLVVYALMQYPLRSSTADHLYSFGRHSKSAIAYYNAAARPLPQWVLRQRFDAIIFHTSFLSSRWDPATFELVRERVRPLLELDAARLALPQDEFIHTDSLTDFLNEANVDDLYSVAPEAMWPIIYRDLDRATVRIHRVLTGYLSEDTVQRIERILSGQPPRDIAIGYRAWEAAAWLGRHGRLKAELAQAVEPLAAARGLRTDISTRDEDTIFGDDWFRFLARCRYTIGVEGGASILDRSGSIRARTEAYTKAHPRAPFHEIEAACFPGEDGRDDFELVAISPRHLEACATRTGQVLVEGDYNGILEPNEHYLPVRRDLSNLDAVLDMVADDKIRKELTDRAFEEVVASGRVTYRNFVEEIEATGIRTVLKDSSAGAPAMALALEDRLRLSDRRSWLVVRFRLGLRVRLSRLLTVLHQHSPSSARRAWTALKDWRGRSRR